MPNIPLSGLGYLVLCLSAYLSIVAVNDDYFRLSAFCFGFGDCFCLEKLPKQLGLWCGHGLLFGFGGLCLDPSA